ncbi:hypothetical protein [Flavobacterium psychrophilum]|uniref:hypothetical protein n=1 Tax=Flavobacterium psychrophilum TaxID=96345 RepID=UPI000B7C2242|nr:hypothetical protein [Flavobacterium psychrophilum]SNA66935.1 hypothetical protein FI070_130008 [Flavobacterium psychrophilum]SNB07490.1 hypothetical protein KU05112810_190048 [Flavobacterium psychrophilum]
MDLKIGQKIWLMLQNKPVEIVVSKIVITEELVIENENPYQKIEVYASNNSKYLHEFTINSNEVYASKLELMTAVFGLKKVK